MDDYYNLFQNAIVSFKTLPLDKCDLKEANPWPIGVDYSGIDDDQEILIEFCVMTMIIWVVAIIDRKTGNHHGLDYRIWSSTC